VEPGYPPLIYKRQFVPPAEKSAESPDESMPLSMAVFLESRMDFMKIATIRRHARLLGIASVAFALGLSHAGSALAQVPPRFYIDNLSGSNAVPVIFQSMSGNANPIDPAHVVSANADIQAEVAVAGYARLFPLFDRSALAAVLLPMGNISSEATVGGQSSVQSASGFGDRCWSSSST